jgi:hypothetical protein
MILLYICVTWSWHIYDCSIYVLYKSGVTAAHKEMGVTGVFVMLSFFKHQIQPIQQRHMLGFEYMGTEDPSQMCADELTDDAALIRVKRVPLHVNAVPYVPELFSAQNPPKPVRVRLVSE